MSWLRSPIFAALVFVAASLGTALLGMRHLEGSYRPDLTDFAAARAADRCAYRTCESAATARRQWSLSVRGKHGTTTFHPIEAALCARHAEQQASGRWDAPPGAHAAHRIALALVAGLAGMLAVGLQSFLVRRFFDDPEHPLIS